MEKEIGISFIFDFMSSQYEDAVITYSDTTKIEILGYKATTSLENGIIKFV